MSASIPVFVSAPTAMSSGQRATYTAINGLLKSEGLEARALGRSDFAMDAPLREVCYLARHCSGGVVLGFTQFKAKEVTIKPDTPEASTAFDVRLATPWNQLEAGVLFAMGLPLLVFREDGVAGGVFDEGTTEVFVQMLPLGGLRGTERDGVQTVIRHWAARVRERYRMWPPSR